MICYMPFTHIEEPQLRLFTGLFGAITIYSPAEAMVPGKMQQWAEQDLLEIRHPGDVEGERVSSLVREYKGWAELHQGNLGDVAGFLKSRPERFAMMEETNPSQIRHQVRHFGEQPEQETTDPLLGAALFLSLAQEFDSQQYAMDREMETVQVLERRMMEQISGGGEESGGDTLPMGQLSALSSRDPEVSPEMIPQRIRAWAMLALGAGDADWLYMTPSRQVFEHILDLLPGGIEIYNQPLGLQGDEASMPPAQMREMVRAMSLDPESAMIEGVTDVQNPLPGSHLRMMLYRFPNLAPRTFLKTLSGVETATESTDRQTDGPSHTMVGLVTADAG